MLILLLYITNITINFTILSFSDENHVIQFFVCLVFIQKEHLIIIYNNYYEAFLSILQ